MMTRRFKGDGEGDVEEDKDSHDDNMPIHDNE